MKGFEILFVDGNNLAFQALGKAPLYFEGARTELVRISLSMIRSYVEKFSPEFVVVAWDAGRDAQRLELHPDYKRRKKELTEAEREERRIAFAQMDILPDIFASLGIRQYKVPGREADDVLYSLLSSDVAADREGGACVASTDRDMFQLFEYFPRLAVYSPVKKILYKRARVEREFGFPVGLFSLYRAFVGDPGDNLPGVRGVGPKKATDYLQAISSGKLSEEEKASWFRKLVKVEEEFDRALGLTMFIPIPDEELDRGEILAAPFEEMEERAIIWAEALGFERVLDNLSGWLWPFKRMFSRRGAK